MRIEIKLVKAGYAIDVTDESYNAIKLGTVEDKNSKNYGNVKETVLGYCTTIESAIKTVIKNKIASEDETVSLNEYIFRLERYADEIKSFVNPTSLK